jgi:hypothetical protein
MVPGSWYPFYLLSNEKKIRYEMIISTIVSKFKKGVKNFTCTNGTYDTGILDAKMSLDTVGGRK